MTPDRVPPCDRRQFFRAAGCAVALATGGPALAAEPAAKPAEELVREFFATLTAEQKRKVVLPWDHPAKKGGLARLTMTDSVINYRIGDLLRKPQQELVERILRALCADDEGYRTLSRNNTFDDPNGIASVGANVFGDPTGKEKFSCVFTGHHTTVRCDGNSEPDTAFGGPLYFGHVVHGYSKRNNYFHLTKAVTEVYDALSEKQRQQAIVRDRPNDNEYRNAVEFRPKGERLPGLLGEDMTADQRKLIEGVMAKLLGVFRKEDVDEVMAFVKANGGADKLALAFYENRSSGDERWQYWKIEGPGFVWGYRVMPHVHCYVNVGPAPK
ncbi:DUF3500 domain-containing protein [Limnoglobus roseus]|uniref:DUF3500 domain-containing protein n=1 Tax=Limnoglobus roseus TaxID=2598579 RepID=A0A5C1ACD4_9BACT|nr:DUF3500 domain-containing protein [Limnoglobus roseus]QEL16265.1 hypothetical protein PX52LOC_03206 [Limnoglobus roseus]